MAELAAIRKEEEKAEKIAEKLLKEKVDALIAADLASHAGRIEYTDSKTHVIKKV